MAESKGKWTREEEHLYLYRAIEQLEAAAGSKLKASNVHMDNRTPKACVHFWDRFRKDVQMRINAEGANGAAPPTPSTPASKRASATPGSRKRVKKEIVGDDEGEGGDEQLEVTTPLKRQRKTPVKQKAKAPVHAAEDQGGDIQPKLEMEEQDENVDGEV